MRNLERRIADLERSLKRSSVYAESDDSHREFIAAVLRAIAHVRRQPIDLAPLRYEVDKLHALEAFDLAAYVTALTVQEHPDEAEARQILESKGGDPGLRERPEKGQPMPPVKKVLCSISSVQHAHLYTAQS